MIAHVMHKTRLHACCNQFTEAAHLTSIVPEAAAVMTPSPMVMLVPKTASSSRACCTLLLFLTAAAALSANGFVFRPLQCRDRALHKLLQVSYQHQSQAERLQEGFMGAEARFKGHNPADDTLLGIADMPHSTVH